MIFLYFLPKLGGCLGSRFRARAYCSRFNLWGLGFVCKFLVLRMWVVVLTAAECFHCRLQRLLGDGERCSAFLPLRVAKDFSADGPSNQADLG